jgi:hypothetical protein
MLPSTERYNKVLNAEADVNSVWETVGDRIKISTKETLGFYVLKKHKSCLDEGCSKLLDKKKNKLNWNGCRIQAE